MDYVRYFRCILPFDELTSALLLPVTIGPKRLVSKFSRSWLTPLRLTQSSS